MFIPFIPDPMNPIDFTQHQLLLAFLLTLFAGLSTGIGSAIAFFTRRTNTSFLSVSLGLSAGVMIYISFVELLADSFDAMKQLYGDRPGTIYSILSFFGGILLIALIDRFVPEKSNPHEMHSVEEIDRYDPEKKRTPTNYKMLRVGLVTAAVLAIHNFPEGMVTFLSGLKDTSVAIPIAVAIAIHNVPEGISVSVPVYYATGNRKKAFWLSFLSGLAEPLGAVIGYLILMPFLTDATLGIIFAAIAGIMVYISLDELLPAAEEYGKHHHAIYGLIAGMVVMAVSLVFL